jgi:hypothetical protein
MILSRDYHLPRRLEKEQPPSGNNIYCVFKPNQPMEDAALLSGQQ